MTYQYCIPTEKSVDWSAQNFSLTKTGGRISVRLAGILSTDVVHWLISQSDYYLNEMQHSLYKPRLIWAYVTTLLCFYSWERHREHGNLAVIVLVYALSPKRFPRWWTTHGNSMWYHFLGNSLVFVKAFCVNKGKGGKIVQKNIHKQYTCLSAVLVRGSWKLHVLWPLHRDSAHCFYVVTSFHLTGLN